MATSPSEAGFTLEEVSGVGYWSLKLGQIEVCLEPQVFGAWELAVYESGDLALERKLPLDQPSWAHDTPESVEQKMGAATEAMEAMKRHIP